MWRENGDPGVGAQYPFCSLLRPASTLRNATWSRNLPLPSPAARPIKTLLTVYSSGCTAFGHPAGLAHGPLPDKRREGTSRVKRPAAIRSVAGVDGPHADVLVDDNRGC